MLLSRKLDQNTQKNALFLGKNWKIVAALGALAPNRRWPPAAGDSAPRAPSCYHHHLLQLLSQRLCNANVIAVRKEQKYLRNSNNVLLLPLISSNSAQGIP